MSHDVISLFEPVCHLHREGICPSYITASVFICVSHACPNSASRWAHRHLRKATWGDWGGKGKPTSSHTTPLGLLARHSWTDRPAQGRSSSLYSEIKGLPMFAFEIQISHVWCLGSLFLVFRLGVPMSTFGHDIHFWAGDSAYRFLWVRCEIRFFVHLGSTSRHIFGCVFSAPFLAILCWQSSAGFGRLLQTSAGLSRARQSSAELGRARQGSAGFGRLREASAGPDRARQGSAGLGRVRQSSAELGKLRQASAGFGRARQGSTELGRAWHASAVFGRARQGSAELGRARQASAELGKARQGSAELGRARQSSTELGRARQGSAEPKLGRARQGFGRASAGLGRARQGSAELGRARQTSAVLGRLRQGSAGLGRASAGLGRARQSSLSYF